MSTTIKATNTTVTDSLKEYIEKKVAAFEKFITGPEKEMQCDVELRGSGHHSKGPYHYAEINLSLDGELYRATAEGESFEAAIDIVKDEIVHELSKSKAKRKAMFRRGASKVKNWLQGLSG